MILSLQISDIGSSLSDGQEARIHVGHQFNYMRPPGAHLRPVPTWLGRSIGGPHEMLTHLKARVFKYDLWTFRAKNPFRDERLIDLQIQDLMSRGSALQSSVDRYPIDKYAGLTKAGYPEGPCLLRTEARGFDHTSRYCYT